MNIYDTREGVRLEMNQQQMGHWNRWGPFLAERAWGTVREDYSADGDAWNYFPHDHARSRAYRWNEDGLAGICDRHQYLCFALALWNGHDPFLKERIFGLTGNEGNHGEDVKEYYFYLDNTPTHSYMKYLYKYPQAEYPYEQLIKENRRRSRLEMEYELVDTGIFDQGRYFDVRGGIRQARAGGPADPHQRQQSRPGGGADSRAADALVPQYLELGARRPPAVDCDRRASRQREAQRATLVAKHWELGDYILYCSGADELLFTENETNTERLFGSPVTDALRQGCLSCVRGERQARRPSTPPARARRPPRTTRAPSTPGETITLDLAPVINWSTITRSSRPSPTSTSCSSSAKRRPTSSTTLFCRRSSPRMPNWWRGRPSPACCGPNSITTTSSAIGWRATRPSRRRRPSAGRGATTTGRTCSTRDVISMPDKWEFPWFASWDLGFHCIALAHVDPQFAKDQIILMLREWYMHPNGQIPAYEWDFDDVNPPVLSHGGAGRLRYRATSTPAWPTTSSWSASSRRCCSTSPGGSTARTHWARTFFRAASWAWTTSARSTAASCRRATCWGRPTARAGWPPSPRTCWRSP